MEIKEVRGRERCRRVNPFTRHWITAIWLRAMPLRYIPSRCASIERQDLFEESWTVLLHSIS